MRWILMAMMAMAAGADWSQDFQKADLGKPPAGIDPKQSDFQVKRHGDNGYLELAAVPLGSHFAEVGPAGDGTGSIRARILGESRGQRRPEFGVGLGGVAGWRLWVVPMTREVELVRGSEEEEEIAASAPIAWRSGEWMNLLLRISRVGEGRWRIEGKAWMQDDPEPKAWTLSAETDVAPRGGKATVWGVPYSEKPMGFDDLKVGRAP